MHREQPNVLFIVMDTARFDYVFPDQGPEVMPQLRELAEEGTLFSNAMATAPWTVPSHGSMFTGQYPSEHGAHAGNKHFAPDQPPLAERFRQAGYQTAGFSNNTWLSQEFGFSSGFESFFARWELFSGGTDLSAIAKADTRRKQVQEAISALTSIDAPVTLLNLLYSTYLSSTSREFDSGGRRTNKRLINWLRSRGDRPFFAFVNYVEPHLRYDPPEPYHEMFLPEDIHPDDLAQVNQDPWAYLTGEIEMSHRDFRALRTLYRGELCYLDRLINEVYEHLEASGALDETVIVVVGDHGENLGDFGLMDHQYSLYESLLHVPLVVRYPALFPPGKRVEELVELRDLFPTLLEAASIGPAVGPNTSTKSLIPDESFTGRQHTIAEYLAPQPTMEALAKKGKNTSKIQEFDRALRSIRTQRWKYIEGTDDSQKLYDLESSGEESNVLDSNPEIASALEQRLQSRVGEFRSAKSADSDIGRLTKQRLEDLGYLQ